MHILHLTTHACRRFFPAQQMNYTYSSIESRLTIYTGKADVPTVIAVLCSSRTELTQTKVSIIFIAFDKIEPDWNRRRGWGETAFEKIDFITQMELM